MACSVGTAVATSLPRPAGLPLDSPSWAQTSLVVHHLLRELLEVIQQLEARLQTLEARIAELEARLRQRSHNSDRPPSSDPPYEKRPARAGTQGKPGAKPGHRGHQQALLPPTEVIKVKPESCPCGQREFPTMAPYYTHQVLELPEIQMSVTHVVLHATQCPGCGRRLKAELPAEHRYGYGPRLTALLGGLSGGQRDSRTAVQEFCVSVLGIPISRGVIQWHVPTLAPWPPDMPSPSDPPRPGAVGAEGPEAGVVWPPSDG
jgi:transposase